MHLPSFIKIFFAPELRSFLKRFGLLLGIIGVMFMALWSMGFSAGSKELLAKRMDSPFIRYLSLTIPSYKADDKFIGTLNNALSDDQFKERMLLTSHYFVPIGYLPFTGDGTAAIRAKARLIDPQRSLYQFLFRDAKSDLLLTKEKLVRLEDAPWACVVSVAFLAELGYDINTPFPTELHFVENSSGKTLSTVPIPIAAVCASLPDKADVLFSPLAFYNITNRYEKSAYRSYHEEYQTSVLAFLRTALDVEFVQEKLRQNQLEHTFKIVKNIDRHAKGYELHGLFSSRKEAEEAQTHLAQAFREIEVSYSFPFDKVYIGERGATRDDFLVLEMASLDSIPALSSYLESAFELEVELNDVESAKNFNIFNSISTMLSIVLSLFTVIIIVYIISKTIIEHIDRNAASLGTLKAFGLSNRDILLVYAGIALLINLAVFLISFLLAKVSGSALCILFFGNELVQGINSKDLFALQIGAWHVIMFVMLPLGIITQMIHQKIKRKTPGDLIYGR